MAGLLAAAAALLFSLGTVLQQREAMRQPAEGALPAGLLVRLARKPVWLLGIGSDGLGFAAQAAALGIGSLVVVQPILAASVVFALPLGVWLTQQRVGRREVLAAIAVTAGLGAFLVISDPSGGRDDASAGAWIAGSAPIAAASAVLALVGVRARPAVKATLFGTAAGLLFGLSAALTKATVDQLTEGVLTVFVDWHLYALAVVGFVSMTYLQISLSTGALAPAVATSAIFDPLASLVLGTAMLGEAIHDDAAGLIASVVALAAMFAGITVLAASSGAGDAQPASAGRASPRTATNRSRVRRRA